MLLRSYTGYTHHIEMGIGCVNPLHTVLDIQIYILDPRGSTPHGKNLYFCASLNGGSAAPRWLMTPGTPYP